MRRIPLLADRTPWATLLREEQQGVGLLAYAVSLLCLLPSVWVWPAVLLVAVPGALVVVLLGRGLERVLCCERTRPALGSEVGRTDGNSGEPEVLS